MCRWLPKNEPCNIPSYAHTMIGVGGLVVDSNNRILVVKERFWKTPSWKLPGGFVEAGKFIFPQKVLRKNLQFQWKPNFFRGRYGKRGHSRSFWGDWNFDRVQLNCGLTTPPCLAIRLLRYLRDSPFDAPRRGPAHSILQSGNCRMLLDEGGNTFFYQKIRLK